MYQGLKIPLMQGGTPVVQRPVIAVAGRNAAFRIFVAPEPSFQPRNVRAVLRLAPPQGTPKTYEVIAPIQGAASSEANYASTINFEISGAEISPDMGYSVSLYEAGDPLGDGSPGAEYPAAGSFDALSTRSSGKSLKLVLVPIAYQAGGSLLPDTSPAQIEKYRQTAYKVYPVPEIEIRMHAPVAYGGQILRTGQGWGQLLQTLLSLRQQEVNSGQASADEYYYGLVTPAPSFFQYCQGGCVGGLSAGGVKPSESTLRGSVGTGFSGNYSADTLVHEIGHALGRLHSPCAPPGSPLQNIDP